MWNPLFAHRARPSSFAVLGALLILSLTACGQNGGAADPDPAETADPRVTVSVISAEVATVEVEVVDSAGDTTVQTATIDAGTGTASATVANLPFGTATFTATGYDANDVALYRGSTVAEVAADMDPLSILMDRLTGSLAVTATGEDDLDPAETVIATIGGARQRLTVQVDGTATGVLQGIATGSGLSITVQSLLGDDVVRSGSASDVTVPDGEGSVTVALADVDPGESPPAITGMSTDPADPVEGEPFDLTVTATDPDGDLASISVVWGDGSPQESEAAAGGTATFTHTYTAPGPFTITAAALDAAGNFSLGSSLVVQVGTAPSDTDVDVGVDVDGELAQVDLVVAGISSGVDQVQAVVTDADAESFTVELLPEGTDWTASFDVLQNADYDVVLVLDPGTAGEVESDPFPVAILGDAQQTVELTYTGGGTGSGDDPALAPTTTCSAATAVGANCTVSIVLEGNEGSFDNFQFAIDFANGNFALDGFAAGSLTTGWLIEAADSVGGISTTPVSGNGELAVLTLVRESTGPDDVTFSGFIALGFDEEPVVPGTAVLSE